MARIQVPGLGRATTFGGIGVKTAIQSACLALPLLAGSVPAMADLTGSYTVTLGTVRPGNLHGATACVALVQDGSFGHWATSGTWSINGTPAGNFYAQHAIITLFTTALSGDNTYATFTGRLYHNGIIGTAVTEVIHGGAVVTGNFTASRGC
jgi:hypothetical protein